MRVRGAHVLDVPILRPSARLRAHSGERQTTPCMGPILRPTESPDFQSIRKTLLSHFHMVATIIPQSLFPHNLTFSCGRVPAATCAELGREFQ